MATSGPLSELHENRGLRTPGSALSGGLGVFSSLAFDKNDVVAVTHICSYEIK